jgi:hypothetical protein
MRHLECRCKWFVLFTLLARRWHSATYIFYYRNSSFRAANCVHQRSLLEFRRINVLWLSVSFFRWCFLHCGDFLAVIFVPVCYQCRVLWYGRLSVRVLFLLCFLSFLWCFVGNVFQYRNSVIVSNEFKFCARKVTPCMKKFFPLHAFGLLTLWKEGVRHCNCCEYEVFYSVTFLKTHFHEQFENLRTYCMKGGSLAAVNFLRTLLHVWLVTRKPRPYRWC